MITLNMDKDRKYLEQAHSYVFIRYNGKKNIDLYFREDADAIVEILRSYPPRKIKNKNALDPEYWRSLCEGCDKKLRIHLRLKKVGKRKGNGRLKKRYTRKYDIEESFGCYGKCVRTGEKCTARKGVIPGKYVCECQ